MADQLALYRRHFVDNGADRLDLFRTLRDRFAIGSAVYLGSFVHVTPALVFPRTAFVDNDRRTATFFAADEVREFVSVHRDYTAEPDVRAFQQNYEQPTDIEPGAWDLLISQWAGFVSQAGKRYLRLGGYLLVNNSHGDAGMAHLDPDYELVGVARERSSGWHIDDSALDEYFIPKQGAHPTAEALRERGRGVGYTKTAPQYLFRRRG